MLALLPLLTVASTIDPGAGAKLLGWTADGHALVWTSTVETALPPREDDESMNMELDPDERVSLAIVHDVRHGTDQVFVLAYKALGGKRTTGTLKKKYASAGTAAAFTRWKQAHPLTRTAGKNHAKGVANVTLQGTEKAARWKGSSISWEVTDQVTVTTSTTCSGVTNKTSEESAMGGMYVPTWTATPIWDPTGHRVVFALDEAIAKTMRGPDGGRSQYIVMACGPRVEVVAPRGREAASDKVADALEKVGYTVVSIGPARARRPATIVYTDPSHAALAAKVAAAVPGGATVDKLTWKPQADIVIAVGDSAK